MALKVVVRLVGLVAVLALAEARGASVSASTANLSKLVPPTACICLPSITR